MDDFLCPFCGSDTLKKPTGAVEGSNMKPIMTFCCKAQSENDKYAKKFDQTDRPTPDEVANR